MKIPILVLAAAVTLTACSKGLEAIDEKLAEDHPSTETLVYTIKKGAHYCDNNSYRLFSGTEMKFAVKFDSSAIYQTISPENQYDINKLAGFSDNGAMHHDYSARIGWRWSDGALRLFAYVYNKGVVTSRELTAIPLAKEVNCSIKIDGGRYLFRADGNEVYMPREALSAKAEGYRLYPYFGGDEAAPHNITIRMRSLD